MRQRSVLCLALVLGASLTACSHRTTEVVVKGTTRITEGQELIDLQRALDVGAINQREYDHVRAKILRR